ncbi:GGDEF domain-containing protein [Colwellia sp. C1TZA3]|uniref:GGDEF domain-containing protein n=1 Tax=Colwellia sp. C1TZA3 TaxID=2508879 RepID=UPI0011B9837F|nr:GGDEF domain-containing protein [Colwellia sp. C1TZA3]TWX67034.1 GGDEF domain-containing protein [Colwellia sp. C1TZA3]
MLIKDNFDEALKFSESTNEFLSHYQIPPSPVNYSVTYLHISKRNEKLTAELERHVQTFQEVDLIFIEGLFEKYISNSHVIDRQILNPIEKSLTSTLEKINLQVDNVKTSTSNLKKAEKALSKHEHHKSMQNIVAFLMKNIASSQQQQTDLSLNLTRTCGEVSFLKSKLKAASNEVIVDSLSGLYNRRGCDIKLKELDIEQVHSSLAIDIDHFKSVNDKFGHIIGDKVIQRIAKVIKSSISDNDIAVRFGGEEFVVVMVNKTKTQAYVVAENIRLAISELKLMQRDSKAYLPKISVSIGVAQREEELNWTAIFEQADTALYQAKNNGRNRSVCL